MFKKILIAMLFSLIVAFAGCGGSVSSSYIFPVGYLSYVGYGSLDAVWKIADNKGDKISDKACLPVVKIESVEELGSFKESVDGVFDLNAAYNKLKSFNDTCENFNSEFFADNCLLIVAFTDITSSCKYTFDIDINDGITVEIKREVPSVADDAMSGWLQAVVVQRTDIENKELSAIMKK